MFKKHLDLRKEVSDKKIAGLDLKGVLITDLILEFQRQNGILSIAQMERCLETVILKTQRQLKGHQ